MTNAKADRGALVIPGGMYGPHTPLLMYASDAAQARGAKLRHMHWTRPEQPPTLDPRVRGPWVLEQVTTDLSQLDDEWPGIAPLFIAKSLGTYAAPLAAERRLPAIWLTPVLIDSWVTAALRDATAPFLLVGGTADDLWDGSVARKLSPHVLEIEDADHGMYVPGRLATSAAVLGQVATAIEDFLDEVVWPQATG